MKDPRKVYELNECEEGNYDDGTDVSCASQDWDWEPGDK